MHILFLTSCGEVFSFLVCWLVSITLGELLTCSEESTLWGFCEGLVMKQQPELPVLVLVYKCHCEAGWSGACYR